MTSFVALRVDAERLRTMFIPELVATRLAKVEGPTGFPALNVTVLDNAGRVIYPAGGTAPKRFVDERTFPLVFYEPDLDAAHRAERRDRRDLARANRLRRSVDPGDRRRARDGRSA